MNEFNNPEIHRGNATERDYEREFQGSNPFKDSGQKRLKKNQFN